MGWFKIDLNNQFINNKFSNFIKSINKNNLYYFVHSYFVDPIEKENIAATYNFGGHKIPAIVSKDNFIGCQFHPEKSGKKGLEIISDFLKLS
jgi:glutamine amidotransferase